MARAASLGLALILAAAPALAETFTETFDSGSNVGGWTFGTGNELIESSGGNPGAYLHDTFVDTFAPQPRTSQPSIFTGDLRQLGVNRIGIDLITYSVDFSAEGRPLTSASTIRRSPTGCSTTASSPETPRHGPRRCRDPADTAPSTGCTSAPERRVTGTAHERLSLP